MKASTTMSALIKPFKIEVASDTLDWITHRVKTARVIPDVIHPKGEEWNDGIPSSVMGDLQTYWANEYDWRKVEARLNEIYKMFTVDLEDGDETINLHFVHHRSDRKDAIPLLFAHGWPGNFTEVENLLTLANPSDPNQQAFHIVAPSLPGFTFSSAPKKPDFGLPRIARIYHRLMVALGYKHYVAQGGDWGSLVLRSVALQYPEAVVGLHINFPIALPPSPLKNPLALFWLAIGWLSPEEKRRIERMKWFLTEENGYSRIQGTKPQTISFGLLDSPIGLLAWIREKMQNAVEPDYVWDKERVITWTMFYLLQNSSGTARLYKAGGPQSMRRDILQNKISSQVAFGASSFPYDIGFLTKWWAQASLADNITFWKVQDKGGHFPSVEVPELLIKDILDFVHTIPVERKKLLLAHK
ncbi:epoxide hydrolase domain-containing protein [Coprinopsis marcescibilis]|uniref:Epoxide hydrolase domain-containing protein n=1 Tax=Coprinopsis marcescibilis TaxID=230819 RepID=A0A5C3L1D3_COPMA|nr:epoxide hydrolase domain-containing protein [Coprinopsis marcescibilis]